MTSPGPILALTHPLGALGERLQPLGEVREVPAEGLTPESARRAVEGAGCVVVCAPESVALPAVRRVHEADATLQVILVVEDEARARTERSLLFAPGLGEVWLLSPEALEAEPLERARRVTAQRRRYRATLRRVEEELATGEPQRRRAQISDAYLATLLQVLPDPVISIDPENRVLTWNPAAERLFGVPSARAVGRPLVEVLAPADPAALQRALAEASRGTSRVEIRFHATSGADGIADLFVVPVEAEGHRVRSVVVHDLTEERRVRRRLEEQAAELERALAARGQFYAAMSHELRTPMNAIIGYNSLLLGEIYGPLDPPQAEALQRAQRAAHHMLELVNDVLDLARIEAGRIELQSEETHLPLLLLELADTVRPMAEASGVTLTLDRGDTTRTIHTDPRRVRQILLNLASNAIKFGEGEPVLLRWEGLPDGGVLIEVQDRGPGIAAEDIPRIFDEFVRLEEGEQPGTGLGLPISRRLADALGGRLDVVSRPGEGSTFRLTLPATLPRRA